VRAAAVVQARVGSSRLPGKILERVGPRTILAHVLTLARQVPGVDAVAVTTTPDPADDVVLSVCYRMGVPWTRGQADLSGRPGCRDVLAGYLAAADALGLADDDVVLRLTSDCPLLDPEVAGLVVLECRRAREAFGVRDAYASNVHPPSWYDGNDAEAFTVGLLRAAARHAGPDQREHVTTWMWCDPRATPVTRANVLCPNGEDHSAVKLSVDEPRDLERVRRVYACLRGVERPTWRDVLAAYREAFPPLAEARALEVYGAGAGPHGAARAAFVAGACSAPAAPCPYQDPALASAWRLGLEDAAAQGYRSSGL